MAGQGLAMRVYTHLQLVLVLLQAARWHRTSQPSPRRHYSQGRLAYRQAVPAVGWTGPVESTGNNLAESRVPQTSLQGRSAHLRSSPRAEWANSWGNPGRQFPPLP